MIKNIGSAEQIRDEIQRRLQENADLGDACRDCAIPLPLRTDPASDGGCNWSIDTLPSMPAACMPAAKAVIKEVMREYDLR
ncbi:hypothetical protein BKK81_32860 (plasmid) [Cupriavidus sp. USMAHM13]|uniref:hypothetical protein n=1 Tax=Cupriavidus sp. USMAHM13 TaxID=1389192 RepID=UPI0008A6E719|nr:hypothetical protein [Cupriavidus sp. USMAHM13]AOZ04191.1 hypothetical protein BKK81_32860 [Cupriavidus sp. USMAHM13]